MGDRSAPVSSPAMRAELLHVQLEQALHLAVDHHERAPEVEEVLPLGVAVAHRPGVRALVDRRVRDRTRAPSRLRLAKSSTSLSPLIHTSAFFARTGSAPSTTCPVVVMSFAFGNRTGMRGSSLPPATTENVTFGSLKSAAFLNRPALSLCTISRLPLDHSGPT